MVLAREQVLALVLAQVMEREEEEAPVREQEVEVVAAGLALDLE